MEESVMFAWGILKIVICYGLSFGFVFALGCLVYEAIKDEFFQ